MLPSVTAGDEHAYTVLLTFDNYELCSVPGSDVQFQPHFNLQGYIFTLGQAFLGKLIPAANLLFGPEMALSCVPPRKVSFTETYRIAYSGESAHGSKSYILKVTVQFETEGNGQK